MCVCVCIDRVSQVLVVVVVVVVVVKKIGQCNLLVWLRSHNLGAESTP